MRKLMMLLILVTLVALPVAAQDDAMMEVEPWVCPEGFEGQTLSVYNWSTYIAEDTVPNFEELCGVSVIYDVFESNEALLSRLREGNPGYDIAVPTGDTVQTMVAEGIIQRLDKDNIPNLENISLELNNPPFDPDNDYSVPYQWGTMGIGYNVETVGAEITSWEQVWESDLRVAWLEDTESMIAIGLLMLGHDPNTSDPALIAEARDYLVERGGNVVAIAQDDGQAMLERGDVDITIEYNGDILQVIYDCECETYAYTVPEEGTVIWVDNLVIPTDAPNKELAEVFIDYILHPQVGADISNYTAYGSPNQAAIEMGLIDEELLNDPGIYPTDETMSRLFFIEDNPDAEQPKLDAWDEIKILIGQ